MKLVDRIHPPRGVRADPQELLELGFPSLSIIEVKGSGRQKGITEQYRGSSADELPAAEDQDRVRGRRPATCRRSSTRSCATRGPGRSATARCSCSPSSRPTASAPASPGRRRSSPTRTRRPRSDAGGGRRAVPGRAVRRRCGLGSGAVMTGGAGPCTVRARGACALRALTRCCASGATAPSAALTILPSA